MKGGSINSLYKEQGAPKLKVEIKKSNNIETAT